jgi:transcriptional regulator with XRE-family HTH domain
MSSKKTPPTPFAARLYEARLARGLTQVQLAEKIGSTQRAISHYESTTGLPPVSVLVDLAKALGVSTDDLLGLAVVPSSTSMQRKESPAERRLWKKFQQVLRLPAKDQRAVIRLINSVALAQPEKRRARG